ITILTPFAAKSLSFSRLIAGFVCVSSTMSPTLVFELLLEKYSFTFLIAIFIAASSDSPREDDAPVSGRRAPNVILCFPLLSMGAITSEFVLANSAINGDEECQLVLNRLTRH